MTAISPFLVEYKILPGYPGCCEQGERQRTEGLGSWHWHWYRTLVNDGSNCRCWLLLCHWGESHSSSVCPASCMEFPYAPCTLPIHLFTDILGVLTLPSTRLSSEDIELNQTQFLSLGACFLLWKQLFSAWATCQDHSGALKNTDARSSLVV